MTENMSDLFAIVDKNGLVLYASPSHKRLLGIDPKKYIGHSLWTQIHPWDQDRVQSQFVEMIEHKQSTKVECQYLRASGTPLSVEVIWIPLVDVNEQVSQIVAMARDVTRRTEAEKELSVTERWHRALFDNHPDAVVSVAPDSRLLSCNVACEVLIGQTYYEITGQSFYRFVVPEYHSDMDIHFSRVMKGDTVDTEIEVLHKDGHHIPVSLIGLPVIEDGTVVGAYGIVKDISERKQGLTQIRGQSRISEMIALQKPLTHILEEITAVVENILPGKLCSISLVDKEQQTLQCWAGSRLPKEFVNNLNGIELGSWCNPMTAAAYNNETVIVADVLTDSRWVEFQESARASNIRMCWCKPIVDQNETVIGTIDIYSRSPEPPSQHDLRIMGTFAYLANVAIVKENDRREITRFLYHDPLTGVANRMLFAKTFNTVWDSAQKNGSEIGLIVLDMDDFQKVNRQLGHTYADEYLKIALERVEETLKGLGMIARIGGDAFAVLVPTIQGTGELKIVSKKLQDTFSRPISIDGRETKTTISMGAVIYPTHGSTLVELLRNAETAMLVAKGKGKRQCTVFDTSMDTAIETRSATVKGLNNALQNDGLLLHYQPRINLRTNKVTGVEALVRWNHPDRGVLYPAEFITIAEETGLIVEIGRWVRREVCRQISSWMENGHQIRVALNISPRELDEQDFTEDFLRVVREYGIPSRLLEIEITESILLSNETDVREKLHRLQEAGFSVSLDDFGTGYSALSVLKRFPFDHVKIDKSIIHDDKENEHQNRGIVKMILQLLSELGINAIAEGVETMDEAEVLMKNGCTEIQGYLYGKPEPASEKTHLFDRRFVD
ncbi:EAL domain-containing protein [Alicyclobacillus sp. SO9]|nr:EAL domain-containing protein [Alicyclobacillus sp. SO9]